MQDQVPPPEGHAAGGVVPAAVFVIGIHDRGVEAMGTQLECLGLSPIRGARPPSAGDDGLDALSRFNGQLLAELGSSRGHPALLPRLELWRRLKHRVDAARRVFEAARSAGREERADGPTWVWADSRNTVLAPFWIKALDVPATVVLVHGPPAEAAAVLSREEGISYEEALALWDEYNRMALSLWEEFSGIVVGVDTFESDPKSGARDLQQELTKRGIPSSPEQLATAIERFDGLGVSRPETAGEVSNKFLVLDRVLHQAGRREPGDTHEMVEEFANYYDEDYYTHYGNEGDAPYRRGEKQWETFFAMLARRIADELRPASVLDAGCAIGFLVEALRNRGIDAWGVDVSEWAISQVPESIRPYCSVASLTDEISGHFDLVTMIEVIEHLPDSVAAPVIANITRHCESLLLSSTSDGFEEATHINVRTPDHWARLLAAHGFVRDFDYDASYLSKDAILFRKGEPDPGALVVGYEQSLWRTREHLQGILDEVVPERDNLVTAIEDYAARSGTLELQNQALLADVGELHSSLHELELRRSAEVLAIQGELLRRDRDTAGLHHLLNEARGQAAASAAQVAAIEATKVFRYTARLRRIYGRLRGRPQQAAATATIPTPSAPAPRLSYGEWAATYDTLTDADRKAIRLRTSQISDPPLISVILPVFNTPEPYLREAVDSVLHQLYPHWELCIADDCSTDPRVLEVIDDYARSESRINIVRRDENGHIAAASNSALASASGRWVVLLDHDDRLREHALALAAIEAELHPEAGLIYSDEAIIDAGGNRLKDYFKGDFDPLLMLGMNHVCHMAALRRDLVEEAGGFRLGFEGSQDWDLVLRVTELIEPDEVRHIPHILYDWRSHPASTAQSLAAKPYAGDAGLRAVSEHLARQGRKATVTPIPALGWNRVRWELPDSPPLVTIIIPTRDGLWLERCLQSIWSYTSYGNYEILVVDNGSESNETLEYLRQNESRVRILRDERPFSYSGLNNAAASRARGSILCLLNDDTEVISADWLDEMVGQLLQPSVGAVGAKLYYENGTIQHAGVVLGIGGVGGHVHRHLDRLEIGYFGRAACVRHYSAVTGACMLVRKDVWDEVGGLDDEHLSIGYNDVDLCLRMAEAGWRTVWTPFAELIHHESVTRGPDVEGPNADRLVGEGRYMQHRWGMLLRNDPAYNPNLSLVYEDFTLACPPRAPLLGEPAPSPETPQTT